MWWEVSVSMKTYSGEVTECGAIRVQNGIAVG
jgi:hypothetical protein